MVLEKSLKSMTPLELIFKISQSVNVCLLFVFVCFIAREKDPSEFFSTAIDSEVWLPEPQSSLKSKIGIPPKLSVMANVISDPFSIPSVSYTHLTLPTSDLV